MLQKQPTRHNTQVRNMMINLFRYGLTYVVLFNLPVTGQTEETVFSWASQPGCTISMLGKIPKRDNRPRKIRLLVLIPRHSKTQLRSFTALSGVL